MDIAERKRQLEASRQRVAQLLAERKTTPVGEPSTPRQRLERRRAKLERLRERQRPRFAVNMKVPDGLHLPLSPRLRQSLGDLLARCGASARVQGHSIRVERRGEKLPPCLIDAVHSHAGGIAAWLRSRSCPECGRTARIAAVPDAPAGATAWQLTCPRCGDLLRN